MQLLKTFSLGSRLFDYIQSITSFLAPPVCAIYVLAIFFKRVNEQVLLQNFRISCFIYCENLNVCKKGAFWGLMIGLLSGMIRFVWQFSYDEPPCAKKYLDKRPAIISKVHYLHFGIILFVITCVSAVTISLCTKPIPEKYVIISISKNKTKNREKNLTNQIIIFNIDKKINLFHYSRSGRAGTNQRCERKVLQFLRRC